MMANTLTRTTQLDGTRLVRAKLYIESDGAAGEITDTNLLDVSGLSPAPSALKIRNIKWITNGCSVKLEFNATTDDPFLVLPSDTVGDLDFPQKIIDPQSTGSNGDILFNTTGFATAGDSALIEIEAEKII